MSEQRLIDANALLQYMSDMEVQTGKKCCTQAVKSCIEEFFPQVVFDQHTIDPETLPIVRELREKLERVTAERDELASLSGKLVVLCEQPKEWRAKLFRRNHGSMIGDYMGSGYPFVDEFDKIYIEFEEKASDGAHEALKKAAQVELQKRGAGDHP